MKKSPAIEAVHNPINVSQSVTASKKVTQHFEAFNRNVFTYEGLWRRIFLAVSILSAFLVKRIYTYQTNSLFDHVKKGEFINLLMFGVPVAVFYTVSVSVIQMIDLLVHFLFDDLCEKYYIDHNKFTDPQARKKRCYTLVKWGFSVLYYGFSSIVCFVLLQKTSYFPTWLGGSGSPENIYNDFPENSEFSTSIEIFYIIQFGKHLSRTFNHFFVRPEGNFYEYGLHHTLSLSLIIFSYTMDQWLIGSFVLLIHDFTDLTLIFARGYRVSLNFIQEFKYRSDAVLKCFYVLAFSTWVLCRIVIFSYAFIYSLGTAIVSVLTPKMTSSLDAAYMETMYIPILFMAGMLIILQGLQLFWTYYILRSYIAVNVSQKIASHNYD